MPRGINLPFVQRSSIPSKINVLQYSTADSIGESFERKAELPKTADPSHQLQPQFPSHDFAARCRLSMVPLPPS
jgi:hypothetical protein